MADVSGASDDARPPGTEFTAISSNTRPINAPGVTRASAGELAQYDVDAVRGYLHCLAPQGWSILWKDEKGFQARSFMKTEQLDQAVTFVEQLVQQGKDVYAQVNPAGNIRKKASKDQLTALVFSHLDLDSVKNGRVPEEDAALLRDEFSPRPHLIVLSGNGVHAYWRLEPGLGPEQLDAVEAVNKALEVALKQTPGAWNADRILRVAGTANFKDPANPKPVRLFWSWEDKKEGPAAYSLGALDVVLARVAREQNPQAKKLNGAAPTNGIAGPSHAGEVLPDELPRFASLEDIPELRGEEHARLRALIETGNDNQREPLYPSRSEALFAAACGCVRAGCSDVQLAALLLDPRFKISASVLDKKRGARKYAVRQINRARLQVAAEKQNYRRDSHGHIYPSDQHNIRLALHQLNVRLSHDLFAERLLVAGRDDVGPVLDDAAINRLWFLLEEKRGFKPSFNYFERVVLDTARANAFHPVVDYLDNLRWDGQARLETWLIDYFSAKDTPYTRTVGRLMLVAAVRRVRTPGCKFDEMIVLEGAQGNKKSSALARLARQPEWFTDDLPLNADSKKTIEQLAGRWIVEASELSGMRRGEVEHLKAMLSRQYDRARPAYGRLTVEYPRQCIIVGTTNSKSYLRDTTGNRRFWPVAVGDFDLARMTLSIVDQLWAEAALREAADESIRLDPSLYETAAEEQEERRVAHPWEDEIRAVLGELTGKMRCAEAWKLVGMPVDRRTQELNNDLGRVMRALGWERTKLRFDGSNPEWCYARGDAEQRKNQIEVRMGTEGAEAVERSARAGAVEQTNAKPPY